MASLRVARGFACTRTTSALPLKSQKISMRWSSLHNNHQTTYISSTLITSRTFSSTARFRVQQYELPDNSYAKPAHKLNQNVTQQEEDHYKQTLAQNKGKQIRTPWHREGADTPPAEKDSSSDDTLSKGKLLTTPSRMLKLVLPLTAHHGNDKDTTTSKDIEPLALLVHPQQPLSYLERLIQSELPTIEVNGKEKIPEVNFFAEDSRQDGSGAQRKAVVEDPEQDLSRDDEHVLEEGDEIKIDGKTERTGKLNRKTENEAEVLRGGHGEGGVESYSGLGREAPSDNVEDRRFVRWSSSTEIGDFIRDAARGQEFSIQIEGAPKDIRIGVPSFNDRTYYLRMRLRTKSKEISGMADLKTECEDLAHRGARRVAMAGFGALCGWWYLVYRLTFETDLGWDVMEPVTYLVGLSTLIGGYVWFLYHNREVSYRSAMNLTISRRLSKLYHEKGFNLRKWESLIEEGNELRKEIKSIANEYDVDWDELEDEKDESVREALRKERKKKEKNGSSDKKKDDVEEEES